MRLGLALCAFMSGAAVRFASGSRQESLETLKSVEQPRRMAVAGRKQCDSAKRVALAYWLLVSDLI